MKYEYDDANANEIIDNYKNENGKIVITFLDGTTNTIPLNKESEENLIDLMIGQAEDRNNVYKSKKGTLTIAVSILGPIVATSFGKILLSYGFSGPFDKTIENVLYVSGVIASESMIIYGNGLQIKLTKDELNDVKKYSIYLANKDKIEEYNDNSDLYIGIDNNDELNINTLDNYSLKDMLKIEKNLLRLEKIDYFSSNELENKLKSL